MNSPEPTSPKEGARLGGKAEQHHQEEDAAEAKHAPWLAVDQLDAAGVKQWQDIAGQPRHPMARIACKILDRYDRAYPGMRARMKKEGRAPGTDQGSRLDRGERTGLADPVQVDSTLISLPNQDKSGENEHKVHYRTSSRFNIPCNHQLGAKSHSLETTLEILSAQDENETALGRLWRSLAEIRSSP